MNAVNRTLHKDQDGQPPGVAVLGASAKPERYSYQAVAMLAQHGYRVFPVHPALSEVQGLQVFKRLAEIPGPLDTITVYLSADRSSVLGGELLKSKPRRVIFNPGAENAGLAETLVRAGIEVLNACTLIMLKTGQFGARSSDALTTSSECIPCFLRQAGEALDLAQQDAGQKESVIRDILAELLAARWDVSPPLLSRRIQRLIRERTGCVDPYAKMKKELNRAALALLPEIKQKLPAGMPAREAAVRLAIGGNALDAGAKTGRHLAEALSALTDVFTQPLKGDWAEFFAATEKAQRILFLADNAGEIVLDRCLLEQFVAGQITVAVRGRAVLNDATVEDAVSAGWPDWITVIDNGSDVPGTVLEECSSAFRERYEASDLIVAKGQGNYETLCAMKKPGYFLFQVKCPIIARQVGAAVGTLVIHKHPGWSQA